MIMRDQKPILEALRDPNGAGVLLHGIAGVGKSMLAAQILRQLADDGHLVISVAGETDPDRLLGAIATRLQSIASAHDGDERDPFRLMAGVLRNAKTPWRERFDILSQHLFAQVPVVVLLENFDDNLSDGSPPAELSALLSAWLATPRQSRLVFTCPNPFTLADDAHARLTAFHIGPASWEETSALLHGLDGLKELAVDDRRRAYESTGGHPRVLEYLDAVLRSGAMRFDDVETRLREHGIADPGGDLDVDQAEAVAAAAGEVLLDALLDRLADDPLARRLLTGAAVYRVPVDMLGLVWPVGEPATPTPDTERTARLAALTERLIELRKENPAAGPADLDLSEDEMRQAARDHAEENAPPVTAPEGFVAAAQKLLALSLLALSLLAPVRTADEHHERFIVHRWTAKALKTRAGSEDLKAAHRAAAEYGLWRAAQGAEPREQTVAALLEARHHLHAMGDVSGVYDVTGWIVQQLDAWDAWEWQERLLRETLAWVPDGSTEAAAIMHRLGIVARSRGDDVAALDWVERSLLISERQEDKTGMAASYGEMGSLAGRRGDHGAAEMFYEKALARHQELGDRGGEATSYHNLGRVAQERGDLDLAETRYRKALDIEQTVGNEASMAATCHQLGTLEQTRGAYEPALDRYRQSIAIKERIGDRRGLAASYHHIGTFSQGHGRHGEALDWYQKTLEIVEEIGDRAGIARSLSQIGILYTEAKRPANAVPMTLRGLSLHLSMQSPEAAINLLWLSRQRQMLGGDAFRDIVEGHLGAENAAACIGLINDYERRQAEPANGRDNTPPVA
jgi:tetratricopeptide (TPR) repeat protein